MKSVWFDELASFLLTVHERRDMKELLRGLLTDGEIEELSRRLQIVKQLKAGVPHQIIAKHLGVGVATVTRGSKEIQKGRFTQI